MVRYIRIHYTYYRCWTLFGPRSRQNRWQVHTAATELHLSHIAKQWRAISCVKHPTKTTKTIIYIYRYIYIYIIWNPTFQFASKIFVSFRGLMSYGSCADFFCFPPLWKSWNSDTPNSNSGANLVQAKHLMPVQVTLDGLIAEHAESIVDFVNWFVQRCQL